MRLPKSIGHLGLFLLKRSSLANPEKWLLELLGGPATYTGKQVNEENALKYSAIFACIRIFSETLGSLPLHTYKRLEGGGKERATSHRLYPILHEEANPEMTSFMWRETTMGHLQSWGNCYSEIEFANSGYPKALWPLLPDHMEVRREKGQLLYIYTLPKGGVVGLPPERVLHIPGLGFNGLVGYSPIAMAREAIGLGLAAEEFGARFFANNARPGGYLRHPKTLSEEAQERLLKSWEKRHQGLTNPERLGVLEEGMEFKEVGIPQKDAQFLETRRFQIEEIARIYRIPLHMLQSLERATFSNIEHQAIEFVVHTLRPWLVRWEQALKMKLIPPKEKNTYFAEFLVDGLMRGDYKTRQEGYAIGRNGGWLSADDICEMENRNPLPDGMGKIYLVPLNMVPVQGVTGQKSVRRMEIRSSTGRRRMRAAYEPIFRDAATRLIKREAKELKAGIKKYLLRGSLVDFDRWLNSFYDEGFKDVIKKLMLPVVTSYGKAIHSLASQEISSDERVEEIELFCDSYASLYAGRHAGGSLKKIWKITSPGRSQRANEDLANDLDEEISIWEDERPEDIAREETVREDGAVAKETFILAGVVSLVWAASGKSCPYCEDLDGTIVGIESNFVDAGSTIEPEGEEPFTSSSGAGHPPLHDG